MAVVIRYTGKKGIVDVEVDEVDTDMTVSDFISEFCTVHNLPSNDYYLIFTNGGGAELPGEMTLADCDIQGSGECLTLYTKNIPA